MWRKLCLKWASLALTEPYYVPAVDGPAGDCRKGVCLGDICCMCMQVGAQNAGKSSLINAMRRAVGHKRPQEELTTAPLPGTTLGVLHSRRLLLL